MNIVISKFDDLCKKGVYCITNTENNKIYIGSTLDSFRIRWRKHIQKLRNNTHPNSHLQNAFNKYGENKFQFSIIEIIDNDDEILEKEKEYIRNKGCCDRLLGYNIESDPFKREVSEETKQKISETLKRKYASGEITKPSGCSIAGWNKGKKCPQIGETRREMSNSIEVYDYNMNLMVTFRSMIDLCEWSEKNTMPRLKIDGRNKKGGILRRDKINLSIRTEKPYKGLYFKKVEKSLFPEMEIAKWEDCVKDEITNTQPSQPLTKLEGSETNS